MEFLYILLPAVVLILAILVNAARIQRPTKGTPIRPDDPDKTALLIVDFQQDFTGATGGVNWNGEYFDEKLKGLNEAIKQAQHDGIPILGIRHIYKGAFTNLIIKLFAKGLGAKGSSGLDFDNRLAQHPERFFEKHIGDAFINNDLSSHLQELGIGHLIIVGLDGNHCVRATTLGALNRGYKVTLPEGAILAQNQKAWPKTNALLKQAGAQLLPH